MGDEEELEERDREMRRDRIEQARWYEKLNLYHEALRIYRSIQDEENIERLAGKMRSQYGEKAKQLESAGKYQEAANLYYLINDRSSLKRIKGIKPDVVIFYDEEAGGLSQLAADVNGGGDVGGEYFSTPNEEEAMEDVEEEPRKKLPVKMPKGRPQMRYCPYCGQAITTKGTPKFCPYCGDEI